MQITEYVCDECGKKRSGDSNHWRRMMIPAQDDVITVADLNSKADKDLLHLCGESVEVCGQDCAVKVFSRWLSTGKLKDEKVSQSSQV